MTLSHDSLIGNDTPLILKCEVSIRSLRDAHVVTLIPG